MAYPQRVYAGGGEDAVMNCILSRYPKVVLSPLEDNFLSVLS